MYEITVLINIDNNIYFPRRLVATYLAITALINGLHVIFIKRSKLFYSLIDKVAYRTTFKSFRVISKE